MRLQSYEEYMKKKHTNTKCDEESEENHDASRAETIEDIADAIKEETCRRCEVNKRVEMLCIKVNEEPQTSFLRAMKKLAVKTNFLLL